MSFGFNLIYLRSILAMRIFVKNVLNHFFFLMLQLGAHCSHLLIEFDYQQSRTRQLFFTPLLPQSSGCSDRRRRQLALQRNQQQHHTCKNRSDTVRVSISNFCFCSLSTSFSQVDPTLVVIEIFFIAATDAATFAQTARHAAVTRTALLSIQ